ncbi:uracil-DNA glycosylase [Halalkalibacterium halodurans]|uniref:Uracil-DNA glycosylase n=1 Tax=Halalkalibacterium halodurans (strain ATCC BAA-125 / DSM 18197 / FERM 7344 / JCM 9153 / C-125) TaxID=272558 RepID=UNG_HALH5|nr:uracil-DNA glycosylase [Halalkalibacterium halodurans]Q9K682.1 RecName: Full=Uracil-DNA glycosylase; Short=UDG [Halalkalibacterium halodurans C-125]MDY7224354.1 uracil-DNA glycosylase [Halalkalibacterium halodurans]MDY7243639.1 uracil-DNA glycosylase [Halalkalibacterium halodurans]MED4079559.1 uracil-DNA glycosylase [Halalkalibacterium halodurans]MED4084164.1 uracil-DNA glycosylase [Halalkalibacterium halodurans]MED4104642.1 uracil-DNA glycosylase [Halalkalibacterium halodurans]
MSILHNDWADVLEAEFQKPYYVQLREFLKQEYSTQTIYPSMYDIFNALHYTPLAEAKVVILGQDPYHGPNQAHGLSFSVKPGVPLPPSLQNIFKELREDLGCPIPNNGHLTPWAEQGVLLLNTVLTVRKGQAASHRGKGWESFTDRVITCLNEREKPVIFVLWGRHAQEKQALITNDRHYILTAPHPSPFSANRGFFGSRPFSTINRILQEQGESQIHWEIPNL